jgi:hypothetical protein
MDKVKLIPLFSASVSPGSPGGEGEGTLSLRECCRELVNYFYRLEGAGEVLTEEAKRERLESWLPPELLALLDRGASPGPDYSPGELRRLAAWVFIAYFRTRPLSGRTWQAVLFALLPPGVKGDILPELLRYKQDPEAVEALALAALKQGGQGECLRALQKLRFEERIDYARYQELVRQAALLEPALEEFPPLGSVREAVRSFFTAAGIIPDEEVHLLAITVSLLLAAYPEGGAGGLRHL